MLQWICAPMNSYHIFHIEPFFQEESHRVLSALTTNRRIVFTTQLDAISIHPGTEGPFLRSYVSSTSPPQWGGDALQPHLFIEPFLFLIFSLNPFCFYMRSSKLYICSCNLYRALVIDNIDNHHTTTPHHRGEGGP